MAGPGASIDPSMSRIATADGDPGATVNQPVPPWGRVLGLDLGSRRVGVAASDSAQTLALGVQTLHGGSDPEGDRRSVAELVAEYEAVGLVVGLPLSLDGGVGPAAAGALAEVRHLRRLLSVPVVTVDERLSTVTASAALRAGGRKMGRQRDVVDRTAAAVILQSWLDQRMHSAVAGTREEITDG